MKQFLFTMSLWGIVLFYPCIASGGTGSIHGVVKGNGEPLVGATVRIPELDRADHTDAKGEFMFRNVPNGTYKIFVRALGYASATNTVTVADTIAETSFTLTESAIQEEDIVITSSPYARLTEEQYQPAESKSIEELHQSSGTSFAEEISDIPGIAVRWMGSSSARPIIRGLNDNDALVLENGLRTGDVSAFDPAHSVPIEPMDIEQINVVRGPASIMYGPNAIGGLVNVITNTIPSLSSRPFSGRVSTSLNSLNDEYAGYFNGVYSSGGSALGISAGGTHSQNIGIPQGDYYDGIGTYTLSRMPQSWDHSWEGGLGYSYQDDFGTIGIGYKYFGMTYGIPGTPPNVDWATDSPTTSLIEQGKNTVEMQSVFPIDGAVIEQIKFDADYAGYWHSEYPTAQDSTGISDPQANHFNLNGFNASLRLQHRQFGSLRGTFGLWTNIQTLNIEGQRPLGPNSTTTDIAGYLYEEYLASESTHLQAALRFDYDHIHTTPHAASQNNIFQTLDTALTSNAITGSFGVIQKLTQEMTFSLNLARSFRAPTAQELFANGLDASSATYSIGASSLVPETGFGIDAMLKGEYENFSFEISPYVNFIGNFIYGKYTGADSLGFPIRIFNQTNARLAGFEASMNVQLADFLALRAGVDYVNGEQMSDSVQPLPNIPPLHGLLRLNYQDNRYSGVIEWRLAAAQNRLGIGDVPTAGYGVVNIGGGIRLPQGNMIHSIGIYCDNLLDMRYYDNLSVIRYYTPTANGFFIPQPGRGLRLNYDLLF